MLKLVSSESGYESTKPYCLSIAPARACGVFSPLHSYVRRTTYEGCFMASRISARGEDDVKELAVSC